MKDKSKTNISTDERNKPSTDQTRQGQRQNVKENNSKRSVETDQSRSTERKPGLSPKSGVTGSDYDGQVAGE